MFKFMGSNIKRNIDFLTFCFLETINIGGPIDIFLGHSQCKTRKTLSQSPRQLITYYLWYFADVAAYLLKKEVEKTRLQVLFRL